MVSPSPDFDCGIISTEESQCFQVFLLRGDLNQWPMVPKQLLAFIGECEVQQEYQKTKAAKKKEEKDNGYYQ
jgi:hypothetical protein